MVRGRQMVASCYWSLGWGDAVDGGLGWFGLEVGVEQKKFLRARRRYARIYRQFFERQDDATLLITSLKQDAFECFWNHNLNGINVFCRTL